MKYIVTIGILLCVSITAIAQDTLTISVGFMSAPQGGISLGKTRDGFKTFGPVFIVASMTKGKITATPFYLMTTNSVGMALTYQLPSEFGTYVVGNKALLADTRYTGIGLTKVVAKGRATGFVEVGTFWDSSSPMLYTGVFIPFTLKLKIK